MEWFWNGFWGGLGYAASGIAIVLAFIGIVFIGALVVAVAQVINDKRKGR